MELPFSSSVDYGFELAFNAAVAFGLKGNSDEKALEFYAKAANIRPQVGKHSKDVYPFHFDYRAYFYLLGNSLVNFHGRNSDFVRY